MANALAGVREERRSRELVLRVAGLVGTGSVTKVVYSRSRLPREGVPLSDQVV